MRGGHLPRSTLRLLRQRQQGCSAISSYVTTNVPEETDPSCSASTSDCEPGQWFLAPQQLGQRSSCSAQAPIGQLQRCFSSEAGGGRGRGSTDGGFVLPDAFRDIDDHANEKSEVSLEGASAGQFEDAESEKSEGFTTANLPVEGGTSEPVKRPPSSILQEIMAASAEESERLGKRPGWKPLNRSSGSAQRLGTRPFNNKMPDLTRMFQPKDSPSASNDGRLFQPRRSDKPSQTPPRNPLKAAGNPSAETPTESDTDTDATSGSKNERVVYLQKKAPRGVSAFENQGAFSRGDEVAENGRATMSLREMFAKSKAEEEERQAEGELEGEHPRDTSRGRGRLLAGSDFQQRVLGMPAEGGAGGAGATKKWFMQNQRNRPSDADGDEELDYDLDVASFMDYDLSSDPTPQDKARRDAPRKLKVDRATYDKMESAREEKELAEGAEETAAEIEQSDWWAKMAQGWEPQEDELGVTHVPELELRDALAIDLEPEYAMETFGVLPDLDDAPRASLKDALTACKEELMEMSGIEDEDTWQAMLKRTLDRTSELEALVKRYDRRKHPIVTARRQHQILGNIHKKLPEQGSPQRTPEMVAHIARALQTLEHNCRWPLQQKKAAMSSLIAQLGSYDGSSKVAKSVQSIFG